MGPAKLRFMEFGGQKGPTLEVIKHCDSQIQQNG